MITPAVEFWSVQTGQDDAGTHSILPDGCFDLVLRCRPGPDGLVDPLLMLSGTADRPVSVAAAPGQIYFGLRFRPGWGGAALGVPPDLLGPDPIPAEAGAPWLRRLARRLTQQCWSPEQMQDLFSRLAVTAVARARDHLRDHPARWRAAWALERLADPGGGWTPARLAQDIGISPRSLRRDIVQVTGLPPQSLAGIFRARHALGLLQTSALPLADVAAVAGYADQAHLTRDLVRFTGDTPAVWRQSGRILQDSRHPLPQDADLSLFS